MWDLIRLPLILMFRMKKCSLLRWDFGRRFVPSLIFCSILVWTFAALGSDTFSDDFSMGINPGLWLIQSNQPLYSVETTGEQVRFIKPGGGTNTLQFIGLYSQEQALGDFDVHVDFTNAQIALGNGTPGNQIQLNSSLGGQDFQVVRSDETAGDTAHVFIDPPATWCGPMSTTATSGTLRVTRTASHVRGYFNGLLLCEGDYNTNAASFSFTLQNNGTSDATSVTFDNFSLVADRIVGPPLRLQISLASSNAVQLQWIAQANTGYVIEHRDSLSNGTWQALVVLDPVPFIHTVTFTDSIPPGASMRFYRVR
jgi:hypothetical protein